MDFSCDRDITRHSESELAETRPPDVSVESTDITKHDMRPKYASLSPVESGSQSGVAGGQATGSSCTGVNNGQMETTTSNVFNDCNINLYLRDAGDGRTHIGISALMHLMKELKLREESTRRDGPISSSIRNEATREETDGSRQDAKMESQVPGVIEGMSRITKQIPPDIYCYNIELIGVKLCLRLGTKHNIENVISIAEINPSLISEVYAFLDDICSKIEGSYDVRLDPENDDKNRKTTSVSVNLSKIENDIIRLLTRQIVEKIRYIAIYRPESTYNISTILFGFIKKIAFQVGNQIQLTANSEETFRGAHLEKKKAYIATHRTLHDGWSNRSFCCSVICCHVSHKTLNMHLLKLYLRSLNSSFYLRSILFF